MVNRIERLLNEVGLGDVAVDECELFGADVLDVVKRAGFKVVDADNAVAAAQQLVAKMRTEKTCAASN